MTAIVIIVCVTVLLSTALVAAGISARPTTPCLFDGSVIFTEAGRFDGGKCSGKPENVYVTWGGPTKPLDGSRVCNGHVKHFRDVADQLVRESVPLR